MQVLLPLLLTLPALAAARSVARNGMVGGWSSVNVTAEIEIVLDEALRCDNYITSAVVCYSKVMAVETQVVAGTNYRFHIEGCLVTNSEGKCSSACSFKQYVVQIYQPLGTKTPQVSSITCSDSTEGSNDDNVVTQEQPPTHPTNGEPSEEEMKLVEEWIRANGLNDYGDKPSTNYLGGTPLFSESTGATTSLYGYIVGNHPDYPWRSQTVTQPSD